MINKHNIIDEGDIFLGAKVQMIMQLRRIGVSDTNVLSAIESVPREDFVPKMFRAKSYDDIALPIESGQTISQPTVVAIMTNNLQLNDRMRVLEIGTGSGYQTSILSKLSRRVYSMERHRPLLEKAEERFVAMGLNNVTAFHGDGSKGWPEAAPFDRIIVTAAAEKVPNELLEQLDVGGIMMIPIGKMSGEQKLMKIIRNEDGYKASTIMDVYFVPLVKGKAND